MTDEAAEQFDKSLKAVFDNDMKQSKINMMFTYIFIAVIIFGGALIINLIGSSNHVEKPFSQVCLETCGQGQVAKFNETTGECECWDGKE